MNRSIQIGDFVVLSLSNGIAAQFKIVEISPHIKIVEPKNEENSGFVYLNEQSEWKIYGLSEPHTLTFISGKDENWGLIFHWGPYSVPAFDDIKSARRRKMKNGSEWYLKRLMETGKYRPISGYKETQEFHKKYFDSLSYQQMTSYFTASKWNPDDWMKLATDSGASYVILTAKHHDGFCLWPTKTTEYNSLNIGPKKDLVGLFVSSARKHNLKVGLYYSWMEFQEKCTIPYIQNKVVGQITELLERYNPDIWWFDGNWDCKTQTANKSIDQLCDLIRSKNINAEINDRISNIENATFRNFTDRYIPDEIPRITWEHINTIGLSWGANRMQELQDFKTGQDLLNLYNIVRSKNGRFLLNFGPYEDGSLDERELKSLQDFIELKKIQLYKMATMRNVKNMDY